jgi:hypothetical protein
MRGTSSPESEHCATGSYMGMDGPPRPISSRNGLARRTPEDSIPVTQTWPEPLPDWPLCAPMEDAELMLNGDGDVPLTRAPDGSMLAWRPEPSTYTPRTFPGPGLTSREEWDSVRLSWAEHRVVDALGGSARNIWTVAQWERAKEWAQTGEDPGPPLVPVWMDQALPDWVRRRLED